MKRKKLLLTLIFVCLCAGFVLTACQQTSALIGDDFEAKGYYKVEFFYNGGSVDDDSYRATFVQQNARMPNPDRLTSPLKPPVKAGFSFLGFYQIVKEGYFTSEQVQKFRTVTHDDGTKTQEPVVDGNKEFVYDTVYFIEGFDWRQEGQTALGIKDFEAEHPVFIKKWNFEIDKVKDNMVLVALWESKREFTFITDANKTHEADSDFFSTDNYAYTKTVRQDGSIKKPPYTDSSVPQKTNNQIEGFYLDRQCLTPVPFDEKTGLYYPPEKYLENGAPTRVPIYIKYIDKKFAIIEKADDFDASQEGIYSFPKENGLYKSLYLKADIDFNGDIFETPYKKTSSSTPSYTGEIRGNGYTLSNFVSVIDQIRSADGRTVTYGGIFSKISSTTIRDISFDNFEIRFRRADPDLLKDNNPVNINILAESIPERCTVRNVNVSNCRLYEVVYTEFNAYFFDKSLYGTPGSTPIYNTELTEVLAVIFTIDVQGAPKTLYGFNDRGASSESVIHVGQTLDNFEPSLGSLGNTNAGTIINGKSVGELECVLWRPDYIRDIDKDNYRNVENYKSYYDPETRRTYTFVGWYNKDVQRFDRANPPQNSTEYRAMFVLLG